jgi:hypothetical protein
MIVKEIEHWRRNKLLPEQYCNFLLNLYLEDPSNKPKRLLGISSAAIRDSGWKGWLLAGLGIAFVTFTVLNFNSFGISLQIGLALLVLLSGYLFAFRSRDKHPLLPNAVIGAASLFLLLIGVYLMKLNDIATVSHIVSYVACCSAVWLLTGLLGRLPLFHFSGWIGLVCTYGWLLHKQLGEMSWLTLQISWLPVSVLFLWAGWLLHYKNKQVGSVLFFVGCLVWFVPEISGFILPSDVSAKTLQVSLFVKLASAVVLLFSLRKKWIEWVA